MQKNMLRVQNNHNIIEWAQEASKQKDRVGFWNRNAIEQSPRAYGRFTKNKWSEILIYFQGTRGQTKHSIPANTEFKWKGRIAREHQFIDREW